MKFAAALCALVLLSFAALAQQDAQVQPQIDPNTGLPVQAPVLPADGASNVAFQGSFLFSPLEVASIQQALRGAPPGTAAVTADKATVVPAVRKIKIAGVVYNSDKDWIVWINGQKVTPGRLLPEIIEINVRKGSVTLKWFDLGLNGIINITMRPHQTYDIVTGLLLPG